MNTRNHIVHFSTKSSKNGSSTEYRPLPVLIKNVQKIFIEELEGKLVKMLDTADDRLFDMAENSYNNAQFDAMRLLRVKREGLLSRFEQELANNFKQTLGKIDNHIHDEDNVETLSFENIALVKDDDLEEDIATDAMVNKARNKNRDALEHLRFRLDTLVADKSVEQTINPLEPVYICDAFRGATQALDLDIASLLVIYKLFDRSVIDELESVYDKVNQFFIDKGILPELKMGIAAQASRAKTSRTSTTNQDQQIIDSLPINEDVVSAPSSQTIAPAQSQANASPVSQQNNEQNGVLSVIQQLLASQRGTEGNRQQINSQTGLQGESSVSDGNSGVQIPHLGDQQPSNSSANIAQLDTNLLLQALSNIQSTQVGSGVHLEKLNGTELRRSLDAQLPTIAENYQLDDSEEQKALGQFNEDMIDIVSMLFDFILEDENLQPELKSVIGRLQIPMLKVGLVDKTFFSDRRHPARVLLNELAHAGLSWDSKDPSALPMFDKISSIAELIIQEFNDDVSLFANLLEDFVDFKKQHQQRAKIFERRTKEAEEGKAKTESARGQVNARLSKICKGQQIPEVAKALLKNVWSHVMLLEILKDNQEAWARRVKVAKLLVWSVQPINDAKRLEQLTSKVPLLIKSLKRGVETISFSSMDAARLFEELEACHRSIIESARKSINQQSEEEILRLSPIGLDGVVPETQEIDSEQTEQESEIEAQEPDTEIESILIEDIGFTKLETGEILRKTIAEPVHIDSKISETVEQLRAGSWVELELDGEFKRCKLAARIATTGKFIFVNRSGMKMAEFETIELCQYLQAQKMKILDDEALFDRALESVITNLRTMKAQA